MPGTDIPVIRQPFAPGDLLPFWAGGGGHLGEHHLYDLSNDPTESENRAGETSERDMIDLLRAALAEVEAPDEHLAAVGAGALVAVSPRGARRRDRSRPPRR